MPNRMNPVTIGSIQRCYPASPAVRFAPVTVASGPSLRNVRDVRTQYERRRVRYRLDCNDFRHLIVGTHPAPCEEVGEPESQS